MDFHLYLGIDEKGMNRFDYKQIIKWMFVITIFFFLGKMVWENWNEVKDASFTFRPFPLILSTLIFAFSYFIQVCAWHLITLKLGIAISLRETLESWFYSQSGKYLPGKIWLLLGRFYYYESRGKSKKLISTALYFEMATIVIAGGVIFLASLFLLKERPHFFQGEQIGWAIFLFLIALLFLHPRFLQKVMNWFLIRFKMETVTFSLSCPDILWVLFVCILAWLIGGVGFYLFVNSIYPVPSRHFLYFTGALAVSSTLGLIAVFAPAGLGVREGALVYFLTNLVPAPVAVILSVTTRLWMTLIEIGLIGIIYFTSLFKSGLIKRNRHVKN